MTEEEWEALPPCEHDPTCSGFGWGHDVNLTREERNFLGLPIYGEISMKKAQRAMRAHRKMLKELVEWN